VKTFVRPARLGDIDAVVAVHFQAFPGFFLTSLGARFLSELYRGFLLNASGRLLVAEVEGAVAGFVAGTLSPERFFRTLLRDRWLAFGVAAAGAAARRPLAVVPRLLSALSYRGERPPSLQKAALLSSIGVEPDHGGLGIGAMLVNEYCEEARKHGRTCVYLTTDRDANDAANRFYLRHGFVVDSEIRRRNGRVMVRYVRRLH
jgi:ribosomal protein S18 acetylase RimI-like enzyme